MVIKQVIVIRKDLKIRRGKEIAQGSHASMAFVTVRLKKAKEDWDDHVASYGIVDADGSGPQPIWAIQEEEWMFGDHTKVTLQVDSLEQLWGVFNQAQGAGLEVHMVTDKGSTEFHGVPTNTCLAIGPDYAEKIDPITAHLKLY